MKMNYDIRSNNRRQNIISNPIKIVFSITILLIIINFFFPRLLSSTFTIIVSPFWNIEQNVKYGNSFVSVSNLIKENEDLKKKIEENESKYYFLEYIEKENITLKEIMNHSRGGESILAMIMKKPPFSAYDIFIIDMGIKDGIEEGDRVYALGNILIGEIAEAESHTSKVKLYSSYGERFNIFIGDNNIETVAIGMGGGSFQAELPRDTEIIVGDYVSIPDLTDSFTGKVYEIVKDPSEPFSKILIRQPVNIYELKWVLIIKSE